MASIDVLSCFTHQGNLTGIHSSVTTFPGLVINNEIQMTKTGECNAVLGCIRPPGQLQRYFDFYKICFLRSKFQAHAYLQSWRIRVHLSFVLSSPPPPPPPPPPPLIKHKNSKYLCVCMTEDWEELPAVPPRGTMLTIHVWLLAGNTCSFSLSQAPEAYSDN